MSTSIIEREQSFDMELIELELMWMTEVVCEWCGGEAAWIWSHGRLKPKSHIVCTKCKNENDHIVRKSEGAGKYVRCKKCNYEFPTDTYVVRPI